jgi:hypothetical protein
VAFKDVIAKNSGSTSRFIGRKAVDERGSTAATARLDSRNKPLIIKRNHIGKPVDKQNGRYY